MNELHVKELRTQAGPKLRAEFHAGKIEMEVDETLHYEITKEHSRLSIMADDGERKFGIAVLPPDEWKVLLEESLKLPKNRRLPPGSGRELSE